MPLSNREFALVIVVIVLGCLFVMLVVVLSVAAARYTKVYCGARGALRNNIYCEPQQGPCLLSTQDDLVYPESVSEEFSYPVARYCADLIARVALLYYTIQGADTLQMPPMMQLLTTLFYHGKIIGFVALRNHIAWVVFRGTAHESEWRQDFTFSQTDLFVSDDDQAALTTESGFRLACHAGFINVYESVKPAMRAAITAWRPEAIVVTGHSLGASVATLASLDLSSQFPVHCYVFGSPRVCNFVPSVARSFWRINNVNDIVAGIPLPVMPNTHQPHKPYFYSHGGQVLEFSSNRFSLTYNHTMPVYIQALEDRALTQAPKPI